MGFQKNFFVILSSAAAKNKHSLPCTPESGFFPIDKSPLPDYNTQESVIVLFFHVQEGTMNTAYLIQQIEQLLREQDSIYHNTAVRFGLSDTAMRVLYLVSETDEVLTQQDLCRQNFSAKQTIHTAINGLVKNGFVELIPIPGTRNHKKILLTASGQELADRTVNRLKEAEQRAYSKLSEEDLQTYLELASRLTSHLREETDRLIQEKTTIPAAADSIERRSGRKR